MERSHTAAVSDASALVNDVEPFRPGRVGQVRGVAHIVDAEGQSEFESLDKIIGDKHALPESFWLRVADTILIL